MKISDGILTPGEMARFALRGLYAAYGYTRYKMNKFEEYDLYANNKDFLLSENVITFTGLDGRLMALKPDVTLSIVRSTPDELKGTMKVCYDENVYRVPKGYPEYREIPQLGLECIGAVDDYCVSECVTLAAKSLALISPEYALDVSHAGLVDAAVSAAGLDPARSREAKRLLSEKNLSGLNALCAGCGVGADGRARLNALTSTRGKAEEVLPGLYAVFGSDEERAMIKTLERVIKAVPEGNVFIDFSVTGDTDYYNGIMINGYVRGVPYALISGGQYDRLMKRMGKNAKAIGFAVYLDLLDRAGASEPEYDVDAVLLYSENDDPALVAAEAEKLASDRGVTVCREVPEKLKYRVLKVFGEGERP